ncbi:MAG TPA: AraC family transcriptional regulator, partial [Lachnospiraceae bacterium]|nr:AraC family transcriptional regulator [Lachnospiraceae bacterium]
IRDITFSCGFSDILSFETYFKEQEGISPEEYMWKYKSG